MNKGRCSHARAWLPIGMQKTINRYVIGLCACSLGLPGVAAAGQVMPGLDLGASYIQDLFYNAGGGLRHGTAAPGIIDLTADVDGRLWGGSDAHHLHFDYLGTIGSSISNDTGDIQGLDNIEAYNTAKIFEAWYQYDIDDNGSLLRVGIQDYNALFDVVDAGGVFINSSFGLDPSVAQTDVSQFPTTTAGIVARWQSRSGAYLMGGVYDGVAGSPGHPNGTHIDFRSGDGVFSALESGITGGGDRPYKLAVGGWYRSTNFEGPAGRGHSDNRGFYALGQQRLIGTGDAPKVDAFVQFGDAQGDRNLIDRYLGAGINVTGLVPGRGDDVLGIGAAQAHVASVYRRATPGSKRAETAFELTYQAQINDYLIVQPDLQYIVNPGVDNQINNATVIGARLAVGW